MTIMASSHDVTEQLQTDSVPEIHLFSGKFQLNKKQVDVSLSSSKLVWNKVESPSEKFSNFHAEVLICDILAITHNEQNIGKNSDKRVTVLDYIHHVNNKERILRRQTVKFSASLLDCQELTDKVNSLVASLKLRPRNLLVIVNPSSGSRSGKKIYQNVAPLFELSQIKTTVIYTERMRHAKELLETYDLEPFDGIVIISGDGLYWEVLNAILLQKQRQAGVDPNDPEGEFQSSQIPIGMIPAGSGNVIAGTRYGNKDPVSAALHVIIGKRLTAPACAIHNNGSLLTYSGLLICYGLFGDMTKYTEENRWLGKARFFVVSPKALRNRRLFHTEIEYLPAPGVEQLVKVVKGSKNNEVKDGISRTTPQGWQKLSGDFHSVDCYLAKAGPGVVLLKSHDNSVLTLITYNRCSAFQHMKTFWGITYGRVEAFQEENVNLYLVKEYKVKVMKQTPDGSSAEVTYTDRELRLDVDGELMKLSTPEMHVRFYKDALQGFA